MGFSPNGVEVSRPGYPMLVDWFERARKGDLEAKGHLEAWFDARQGSILEGQLAREEMGMLSYMMGLKDGGRKLKPKGKYGDLQNSDGSVAVEHWMRFKPFCDDIAGGEKKTVDDFVIRVNALTEYVLLDMAADRNRRDERRQPFIPEIHDEAPERAPSSTVDHLVWLEQKRELLRQIVEVVPPREFLVVILKDYCEFNWAQIAKVLGEEVHGCKRLHAEAIRRIGQNLS